MRALKQRFDDGVSGANRRIAGDGIERFVARCAQTIGAPCGGVREFVSLEVKIGNVSRARVDIEREHLMSWVHFGPQRADGAPAATQIANLRICQKIPLPVHGFEQQGRAFIEFGA